MILTKYKIFIYLSYVRRKMISFLEVNILGKVNLILLKEIKLLILGGDK